MSGESSPRRRIVIAGGTYVETCQWPFWYEIFGSGLRAAAALSGRDCDVALYTHLSADRAPYLASISSAFDFTAITSKTTGLYEFHYRHPLANPECVSPGLAQQAPFVVEADMILSYGMMEGCDR
jgi:hypothetical protein